MQEDFHYYATYCGAYLAGYSHEDSLDIAYSAQFVDLCSRALLAKLGAPSDAATTQLKLEMMDARTDPLGLQDITRIWASFHFLPRDLYAEKQGKCSKAYLDKYRLICGPNGDLVVKTVELAKGKSLQAVGIAMHVLADTWAHMYFAGTPSLVINNTNHVFYELLPQGDGYREQEITFVHRAATPDDPENCVYTSSLFQSSENSIMNLGHGRAGHLPDYSYIRYKYLPAWGDYHEWVKDNPSDYWKAFTQMIYAMKYLRGEISAFEKDTYDQQAAEPCHSRIREILEKRQLIACEDWKALGQDLSGRKIEDFVLDKHFDEYTGAAESEKANTFLGRFLQGALAQKHMVIGEIAKSHNRLAGRAR